MARMVGSGKGEGCRIRVKGKRENVLRNLNLVKEFRETYNMVPGNTGGGKVGAKNS